MHLKPKILKQKKKAFSKLNHTESLSSITRWGLAGVAELVPFILLYCVNKIFIVARRTSDKLCLIYAKKKEHKGMKSRTTQNHYCYYKTAESSALSVVYTGGCVEKCHLIINLV